MSRKDALLVGGLAGTAILLLSIFAINRYSPKVPTKEGLASWSRGPVRAAYIGSQLKEIDKTHSSLIVSYDLENDSDSDYRFAEGPGVLILSRLKSDGSLSQEQAVRLSYPVFLPARQHARLALEITQPFAWPRDGDQAGPDKMREFVRRRLENVGDFVLYDEANHEQVELPGAWEELESVSRASD